MCLVFGFKKLNQSGKQRFRWNLIFNLLVWIIVPLPLWMPFVSQTVAVYLVPSIQAVFVMMWIIVVSLASRNRALNPGKSLPGRAVFVVKSPSFFNAGPFRSWNFTSPRIYNPV